MKDALDIISEAVCYAEHCHRETNHHYDKGVPYFHHLKMVYNAATMFSHLVEAEDRDNFLAAAWTHDLIEDCRQTYNDVKHSTNTRVAELTYALTNEKGKSRGERASDKYYREMKEVKHAVLLKVCDRIANAKYSFDAGSKMYEMYRRENDSFVRKTYMPEYREAFVHLCGILNTELNVD